jgi:predicted nucleotidyltransferase
LEQAEAYKIAQNCIKLLKERFNVGNIYIFGSLAGDGVWHNRSDIDIAVEGLPPGDYLHALNTLYETLPAGIDLDLVAFEDAPARLKERIKAIYNYNDDDNQKKEEKSSDKIDRLKWQVESELDSLEQTANELDKFLKDISERQPNVIELGGIGAILQGFYNGVERIFEHIAIVIDEKLPEGDNWHNMLLNQMEPAVIDHELATRLLEYLRFRHLFRYIYGHTLQWEKFCPLAEGVSDTLKMLREQLMRFLDRDTIY